MPTRLTPVIDRVPCRSYNEIMTEQVVLQIVDQAHALVELASEKQANDIVLLDVREATDFADYFVIMTAESPRQMRALLEDIQDAMRAVDIRRHHIEGTHLSGWVLIDFGDVVVHVLGPEERDFYDLERVWPKAVEVVRLQ